MRIILQGCQDFGKPLPSEIRLNRHGLKLPAVRTDGEDRPLSAWLSLCRVPDSE